MPGKDDRVFCYLGLNPRDHYRAERARKKLNKANNTAWARELLMNAVDRAEDQEIGKSATYRCTCCGEVKKLHLFPGDCRDLICIQCLNEKKSKKK